MTKVLVEAPINPSEDAGKVVAAARNLFPDLEVLSTDDGRLLGAAGSLDHLAAQLSKQRILDTARGVFLRALASDGRSATFTLAKQAAFAGHVSFAVDESPLGDLTVTVEDERAESLLRSVAPKTVKGFPVSEKEAARIEAREKAARDARKALALEGKGVDK